MKKAIEHFCNLLYQKGINNKDKLVREIIRVRMTKNKLKDINNIENDSETLYNIMKKSTEEKLGHFLGDRDFFLEMYSLGKEISPLEFTIQTYRNDRTGRIIIPGYLLSYIDTLIDGNINFERILITDAEKILVGLIDIISKYNEKKFTLTTANKLMYILLELLLENYDNVTVIHQSIYKELLIDDKFDLIINIPEFGVKLDLGKLSRKKEFLTRESDGIAVEILLDYLKEDGFLYTIVPARFAFSGGEFENLRKNVINNYNLHSIHTMPEGSFRPYTEIKTLLLKISGRKNKKIHLGNLSTEKNKVLISDEKEVDTEDFFKYSDWRIDWFLTDNQEEIEKYNNSKIKKIKLKEIADIFRGKSIMKKDLKAGEIFVLNISNIEDGQILYDGLDTIDEEERKIKRYQLEDNDLVITCRGTSNKVAVYKQLDKKVIASANIIVIRLKEKIKSDFLKIFLESPVGKTIIKTFQRGTTVMNINPKDIGEMEIPLLPVGKQDQIIEEYLSELEQCRELIKKAETRWGNIKNSIYEEILQ